MLIDQFQIPTGVVVPGGRRHDDLVADTRLRARGAEVFVLDPEAAAMAVSVALSKPSSIVKTLPFARLPVQTTWIEVVNDDLRRAMATLGSPNRPSPAAAGRLVRSGFLLTSLGPTDFMVEYVSALETEGRLYVDVAPVRAVFHTGEESEPGPMPLAAAAGEIDAAITGKVRSQLQIIAKDPAEAAAQADLDGRLRFELHPAITPVLADYVAARGLASTIATIQNQKSELSRLFGLCALPALILINCRNAVTIEREDLSRLNRKREKSGKPVLIDHAFIRMRLSRTKLAATAGSAERRRILAGSLVIGHFKLRSSGPFWWSPHTRLGGPDPGAARKPRIVSA